MDFEKIYYLYFRDVFLYIKSISGNEGIAEEVVQEAFFKALRSINSFDGSKDIRAWLFTIAKNTYFSYHKKNKRNIGYDSLDDIADTGITISEHLGMKKMPLSSISFFTRWQNRIKKFFLCECLVNCPLRK
jgi:RNA polymerase sigma factor (sigma-70 family)